MNPLTEYGDEIVDDFEDEAKTFHADTVAAFLRPEATEVAPGLTLRPFSAGTMALLREIRSPYLDGEAAIEAASNQEYDLLAALYVMSGDLPTVRRVIWQAETLRDAVLTFAETLTPAGMVRAGVELRGVIARGTVGLVEVLPKPTVGGPLRPEEQAPPN